MTALTLPTKHRSLWHFVPGLALTAALTGAALWAGSFPAIAGAGFSALTLAILFGHDPGHQPFRRNHHRRSLHWLVQKSSDGIFFLPGNPDDFRRYSL